MVHHVIPASYLTHMLRVFGVIPEDSGVGFPVAGVGAADEVSLVGMHISQA